MNMLYRKALLTFLLTVAVGILLTFSFALNASANEVVETGVRFEGNGETIVPPAPEVTGVENFGTYRGAVHPTWDDVPNTTMTATLRNDNGRPARFVKGMAVTDDGSYLLTVSAKRNGLLASTNIRFTIDSAVVPAPVLVEGIAAGGIYAEAAATWSDAPGTSSSATLAKDGDAPIAYTGGTAIKELGSYLLSVTTRELSHGLTVNQEISFTIDVPPSPTRINIWGDVNTAAPVYYHAYLNWWDQPGTTNEAILKKNDGTSRPYQKGGYILHEGIYELTVTTTKQSNGLKAQATVTFAIEKGWDEPKLTGVRIAGIHFEPVMLGWVPAEGTELYNIKLINKTTGERFDNLPNHSWIEQEGDYELQVSIKKTILGVDLRSGAIFSFLITGIKGVEDGATYASAKPDWIEWLSWPGNGPATATLSKDGGTVAPYVRGTAIEDAGEYVLTVLWRSINGISATQTVRFNIMP